MNNQELKEEIRALKKEIQHYKGLHDQKELELEQVYGSRSWRLTSVLRVFSRPVKLVFHGFRVIRAHSERCGGYLALIRYTARISKEKGLKETLKTIFRKLFGIRISGPDYQKWLKAYDSGSEKRNKLLHKKCSSFQNSPLVSILMPVYNPDVEWLKRAVESVSAQLYDNWELCIADDCSTNQDVVAYLNEIKSQDNINVIFRAENGHISAATNTALDVAKGDFIALLDNDDELHPEALCWVVKAINETPDAKLIYSDEDKITINGERFDPYFKCDFNYDLFLSHNMICHLGVYDRHTAQKIGGFRVGFEGAQDWDFALRFIDEAGVGAVKHIPKVLYHWRVLPTSTAGGAEAKDYAILSAIKSVQDHLNRNNISATAEKHPELDCLRVVYDLPEKEPLVSIIIPTRDQYDILYQCVESVFNKTRYKNYEIIIIDNGSEDTQTLDYLTALEDTHENVLVIRDEREFNYSALNNMAIKQAKGELVCLMNNDIEVITPEWLTEMVSHAIRQGVGCVGAKLYYSSDLIQHAGVVLGICGVAGHIMKGLPVENGGYFSRAKIIQNYSAVTAACLIVKRKIFEEVGGLNEDDLKIAFNDVDFCLKVKRAGYRNVWTPFAELYHHESISRGYENTPEKLKRFEKEKNYMKTTWADEIEHDTAYSPNLTLDGEDCSYAFPPRVSDL